MAAVTRQVFGLDQFGEGVLAVESGHVAGRAWVHHRAAALDMAAYQLTSSPTPPSEVPASAAERVNVQVMDDGGFARCAMADVRGWAQHPDPRRSMIDAADNSRTRSQTSGIEILASSPLIITIRLNTPTGIYRLV